MHQIQKITKLIRKYFLNGNKNKVGGVQIEHCLHGNL